MANRVPSHGLDAQGIRTGATLHWNMTTAPLVEQAVTRGEDIIMKQITLEIYFKLILNNVTACLWLL